MNWQDWVILGALALNLAALAWLIGRQRADQAQASLQQALAASSERLERELRDEVGRSAQTTRLELANALALFQQTLLNQQGDVARTQNEQIDSFRTQLGATLAAQAHQAQSSRETQDTALKRFSDTVSEQ